MVTLPAAPALLPVVVADPGAVEDCGVALRAACARLDDLGVFVAGPGRLDDWWGSASQAYRGASGSMGRGADAMSLCLRRVAARVLDHGDAVAALIVRRDDLAHAGDRLTTEIEALRLDLASVPPGALAAVAPALQARAAGLASAAERLAHDGVVWQRALRVEEDEMVAAFERWHSLEAVERRFGGVADPADAALATLPPVGSPPEAVRGWWASLSPAERDGLVVAAPGVIGGLGGVPSLARHRANVVRLARDLAGLRAVARERDLTDDEQAALRNAGAIAAALERAQDLRDPVTGRPVTALLHLYDPTAFDGDGAAVIAVGDPDRADDVSVLVPGMTTDAAGIGGVTTAAVAVYQAARHADPGSSHASLAWVGYDAPDDLPFQEGGPGDIAGVVRETMASRGAEHLADDLDDLRAERRGAPAHLTVVGHSYGSTTVGYAASVEGIDVDDLIVVGSPGLGGDVHHASDLGLDPGHVWVGADSRDIVADSAGNGSLGLGDLLGLGLGDDPASDDFGGIRFEAESVTRGPFDGFAGHQGYFDHDTESLHNISEIVSDHPESVDVAGGVHDPWWWSAQDPERGRVPGSPTTG